MNGTQQSPVQTVDDSKPVIPARIGLRWGALFCVPILLVVLLLLLAAISRNDKSLAIAALTALATSMPILLLAGRWWATRGLGVNEWTFLLTAIAQGLALFLSLLLALATLAWFEGAHSPPSLPDIDSTLTAWGICSVWTLALGAVIVWRVRRALARERGTAKSSSETSVVLTGETATEKTADPAGSDTQPARASPLRRFAVAVISSLGVPLLLSVPVVLLLRYDISVRHSANAILVSQIKTLDAQITDIKDLERVRADLIMRQKIVEHIEPSALPAADALRVFGRLPTGVQLLSLEMQDAHLALAVRCATPARELAILEQLAQSGYRDLEIGMRQREGGAVERVTIEANWVHGDAQ